MTAAAERAFTAWRQRVHRRVCEAAVRGRGDAQNGPAQCTCPPEVTVEVITEERALARQVHAKFSHPGPVEQCESPHDVVCRAVWPCE